MDNTSDFPEITDEEWNALAGKFSVVVQLPLRQYGPGEDDPLGLGTTAELEHRHEVEALLQQEVCARLRQGSVDGGDIGAGTANIFIEDVIDVDSLVEATVAAMLESGAMREGVVIGYRPMQAGWRDFGSEPYRILWPKGSSGDVFLWGMPDDPIQ